MRKAQADGSGVVEVEGLHALTLDPGVSFASAAMELDFVGDHVPKGVPGECVSPANRQLLTAPKSVGVDSLRKRVEARYGRS